MAALVTLVLVALVQGQDEYESALRRASRLVEEGRFFDAVPILEQAAAAAPDRAAPWLYLARCHRELKDPENERRCLHKARRIREEVPGEEPPLPDDIPPPPEPPPPPPEKPVRPRAPGDLMEHILSAPLRRTSMNAYHAFLHVPTAESAATLPQDSVWCSVSADYGRTRERYRIEGGQNAYRADRLEESMRIDFCPTGRLQVFGALRSGALDEDEIVAVDNSRDITPPIDTSFALKDVLFGLKWGEPYTFMEGTQVGAVASIKAPLADDEEYLVSQTVDVAAGFLSTTQFRRFLIHVNLGVVLPMRDPEMFVAKDEADPFCYASVSAVTRMTDAWSLILQFDGNTSAFQDARAADLAVGSLAAGIRLSLGEHVALTGGAGLGATRLSADTSGHFALEIAF